MDGNTISNVGRRPDSECRVVACPGNPSQKCGNKKRGAMYDLRKVLTKMPKSVCMNKMIEESQNDKSDEPVQINFQMWAATEIHIIKMRMEMKEELTKLIFHTILLRIVVLSVFRMVTMASTSVLRIAVGVAVWT